MSLKSEPAEKPIKWYTFYSKKAGRDYYFEPTTGVVTWIRPDDLHPRPIAKPKEEETISRRVSFHESVDGPTTVTPRGMKIRRSMDLSKPAKTNNFKRRRILVLIGALLCSGLLLMVALYVHEALEDRIETTKPEKEHDQVKPKTVHLQHVDEPIQRVQVNPAPVLTAPIAPPKQQAEKTVDYSREEKMLPERTIQRSGEQSSGQISRETAVHEREEHEARDPKCLMPFAYLFSHKCRMELVHRPAYESFGMMLC